MSQQIAVSNTPAKPARTLSLVSGATELCGVEAFARRLSERLAKDAPGDHAVARLPDSITGMFSLASLLRRYDTLVINLPIVAWKRRLIMPLITMILARLRRRAVFLVLHEWSDLDWKRRAVFRVYVPLATRLIFSSPHVAGQFGRDMVSRFAAVRRDVVPIPPNLQRPEGALPNTVIARKLDDARADRRLVLGHFGSIYPKKQSLLVLDIAAELKRRGVPVLAAFIGDFIGNSGTGPSGDPRAAFMIRAHELGLADDVLISGYIADSPSLFAALTKVDVFVYVFSEGLTSRRASVLTCLAASVPVVVNAPESVEEFAHHPTYRTQIAAGGLQFAPLDATPQTMADAVLKARDAIKSAKDLLGRDSTEGSIAAKTPSVDFNRAWGDAARTIRGEAALLPPAVEEAYSPEHPALPN